MIMENLLKTVIGENIQRTLNIFEDEEIDVEAFYSLNSAILMEIG